MRRSRNLIASSSSAAIATVVTTAAALDAARLAARHAAAILGVCPTDGALPIARAATLGFFSRVPSPRVAYFFHHAA